MGAFSKRPFETSRLRAAIGRSSSSAAALGAFVFFFLPVFGGCEARSTQNPAAKSASENAARASIDVPDYVASPSVDPSENKPCPLRIVSSAPSATEICCALGLQRSLVGRSDYCTYPPGVLGVPTIGALLDVNTEHLLALQPDVIFISGNSRALRERLEPLNLRLESLPDVTLENIFESIRRAGAVTARPRTAAALNERIRDALATVAARNANLAGTRVLLLTGTLHDPPQPPFVAGPGSFYDQLLGRVGVVNAAPSSSGLAFAPLSLEYILKADPDVIIELDADGSSRPGGDAEAVSAWAKVGPLQAVAHRRVRVLTGQLYYVPGPRAALVLAGLCQAIQPASPAGAPASGS